MLLPAPYINFDGVGGGNCPPRVISEIRKPNGYTNKEQIRPRISGNLLVICSNQKRWCPRKVTVRGGQLQIGAASGDASFGNIQIPLRHLSLAAGPLPNSFSLCRGSNVVLTIQTASERAFKLWVKTIAIELIRQTPLEAVKYLDILNLTGCWNNKNDKDCAQDFNCNDVEHNGHSCCKFCASFQKKEEEEPAASNEKDIEVLLKKCQNSDNYVPVKEKLVLFESLCRFGRKVRSTEDVSVKINIENKRALSMHDLSSNSITGVRQICKYFENKSDRRDDLLKFTTVHRPTKRLLCAQPQLCDFQINQRHRKENFSHACST